MSSRSNRAAGSGVRSCSVASAAPRRRSASGSSAGGRRVEPAAADGLDGQRAVARADHARDAQAAVLGGAGGLEAAALAPGEGVDLREREHAAVLAGALGARRPLGAVGDEPRRDGLPDEPVERAGAAREQRQRGQPAVVGERPEHGAELRHVQDRLQRRRRHGGGERAPVRAVALRRGEAARGDVVVAPAGGDPVDDAQALADAVLGVLARARLDRLGQQAPRQGLRHEPLVEQRVALRNGGVRRQRHRGITSVRNAASRPCATALTTGASSLTP